MSNKSLDVMNIVFCISDEESEPSASSSKKKRAPKAEIKSIANSNFYVDDIDKMKVMYAVVCSHNCRLRIDDILFISFSPTTSPLPHTHRIYIIPILIYQISNLFF